MDEDDIIPFANMVEYTSGPFMANIKLEKPVAKVYYCHPSQIKDVQAELEAATIPFWVSLGNRPETITSMNLKWTRQEKLWTRCQDQSCARERPRYG